MSLPAGHPSSWRGRAAPAPAVASSELDVRDSPRVPPDCRKDLARADATRDHVYIIRPLQPEAIGDPVDEIDRLLRRLVGSQGGVPQVANVMDANGAGVVRVDRHPAGPVEEIDPGDKALWELVRVALGEDADLVEDISRLETVLAQRAASSSEFFERLAGGWDALRRDLFGDGFVLPTLLSLVPGDLVVADLGCGTGGVLVDLAACVHKAIGVDREQAMLDVAATRLDGVDNVELRHGSLESLPLGDAEVDAALCMLVLHHVGSPGLVDLVEGDSGPGPGSCWRPGPRRT